MNSITLSLLVGFAMMTSIFAETSCPSHLTLVRSAFEVAIDLHAPSEKQISCSRQDNKILENLVEDSMNLATRKIAEWKISDQFKDGDSKVCNGSQQQLRRRLNQQGLKYGFFRYYGGMRCRLCSRDDDDAGVISSYEQILKFDKTSQSIKCHRYLRFNDLTEKEKIRRSKVLNPPGGKSHYAIDVHAPSMAQEFKIQVHFGLGNSTSWTGQHIYIIINGQTFDLGPFQDGPVVEKQSPGFNVTNEVGWSIKPGWKDPSMHLVDMFIPRSFYSKTSMLKVEILFGEQTASPRHVGRVWPFLTSFGTILPASECEVKNPLVPNNRNRKLKRRAISSPTSPVSSPTSPVLSPVFSPHSSPVAAPVNSEEIKRATAKKKNHRGERNNKAKSSTLKTMPPKRKKTPRKKSNVNSSMQRTGTKKKKKKRTTRRMKPVSVPAHPGPVSKRASKKKKKTSSSTRQKTKQNRRSVPKKMKPKRNSSPMTTKKKSRKKQRMTTKKKKTEQQPTDKAMMPDAVPADDSVFLLPTMKQFSFRRGSKERRASRDSHFQLQVISTLSTILQDKIKNTLRPGHCMYAYAKSITSEVKLVPKPDWEKRLPACDGEQS